jgi:uncharacterized Zn finger protein
MPERQPHPEPDEPDWATLLGDSALRLASSDTILARGQAYARSGAVLLLDDSDDDMPGVQAEVSGSQLYTTELWLDGGELQGRCDCPHAADGWFCKHQVAVALVWRNRVLASPAVVASAHQRTPATPRSKQSLSDFLRAQPAAMLAEQLLALARQDTDIKRQLQHWQKLSQLPDDLAAKKSLVNSLLSPRREFLAWDETTSYVLQAQPVLRLLASTAQDAPDQAVALASHALRRAWQALEQADDSNGVVGDFCAELGQQYVAALQASGPQNAAYGRDYLQLLLDDPIDSFDSCRAEDALGAPALACFRAELATRWQQALLAAPRRADRGGVVTPVWTLRRLHLQQLENAGEVDAAMTVLRAGQPDASDHHQMVDLLERHGRLKEASAQAEQAYQRWPDDWRAQDDLLRCCERDGRVALAYTLRQRQFEARPSVATYQAVLAAGQMAGRDPVAHRLALHDALAQRAQDQATSQAQAWAGINRKPAHARLPDVSLRLDILVAEQRCSEALPLALAATQAKPSAVAGPASLQGLAQGLAAHDLVQYRGSVLAVMQHVLDLEMQHAKSPYRRALALVQQIKCWQLPAQSAVWLQQLRLQHKAKRNFVAGLPQA